VRVLVHGEIAAPRAARLRELAAPGWTIETWNPAAEPAEAFAAKAATAQVLVGGSPPGGDWPVMPELRLWQIPWTGVDFTAPDRVPEGVPVANCYAHETTVAEYVLASMLEWRLGLRRMDARFRAEGWGGHVLANGPRHGEVRGRTVGIVGHGHIGREVATRARAFGMAAIGIRRSACPCPPELDWLGGPDDLHRLLGASDFVVLACDLNDATRGMIDAAALGAMKPDGVLINVARGAVVAEDALWEALSARRIGGAVIDVWWNYRQADGPEPWPANHPFETLDNVILSAHESANTPEMLERRLEFVAANIGRVARGEAPENVVFIGAAPRG
jgi:phosphoglycerate dehydrogenase-like enzyme